MLYYDNKEPIIEGEIWKDVIGFEGIYQVSDLGRVKSLPRKGTKGGIMTQHERRDNKHNKHYLRVPLSLGKRGQVKWVSVHRLVAQHFIDNYCEELQVDHINNNEMDNRACNLQMLTGPENVKKDQGHRVKCVETGQIFECKNDALKWLSKTEKSSELSRACDHENRTAGGYHWRRV